MTKQYYRTCLNNTTVWKWHKYNEIKLCSHDAPTCRTGACHCPRHRSITSSFTHRPTYLPVILQSNLQATEAPKASKVLLNKCDFRSRLINKWPMNNLDCVTFVSLSPAVTYCHDSRYCHLVYWYLYSQWYEFYNATKN